RQLGVDSQGATRLAAAITDWRAPTAEARPFGAKAREYRNAGLGYGPPDAPFRSIGELGAVLGMTPPLLARLAPHLSLFNDGDPEPGLADPLVLRALRGSLGAQEFAASPQTGRRVVAISATAIQRGRGGTPAAEVARFARRAVVRVGEGSNGAPFQILAWGIEED
ncbi:MAG: general secretion pathway protein GspK, partial [Acetobacteraceae bacterium]